MSPAMAAAAQSSRGNTSSSDPEEGLEPLEGGLHMACRSISGLPSLSIPFNPYKGDKGGGQ